MIAFGTFDNFNEVVAGLKGSIAIGAGMISDTLMVSSLDEVSTEYGLIAEAVSHPADFASTTFRLRAAARHHDGKPITVEDVIYSLDVFKKHSPATGGLLSARGEGGEDRGARSHLRLRRTGQSRDAGDPRPAQRAAQALVGGNRRVGQETRHRRHHARAAARQWRLSHQGLRRRPHRRLRARQGLLGQGSQRQYRPRQFRRDPLRVFSRFDGRDRSVQGRSRRLAHREQRQELGDGLRFPCREGQARHPGGVSPAQPGHHAGFRLQHPARQVQGCAAAARIQLSPTISRR